MGLWFRSGLLSTYFFFYFLHFMGWQFSKVFDKISSKGVKLLLFHSKLTFKIIDASYDWSTFFKSQHIGWILKKIINFELINFFSETCQWDNILNNRAKKENPCDFWAINFFVRRKLLASSINLIGFSLRKDLDAVIVKDYLIKFIVVDVNWTNHIKFRLILI